MTIEIGADEIEAQLHLNQARERSFVAFVPLFSIAALVALVLRSWWALPYASVAGIVFVWARHERRSSAVIVSISDQGLILRQNGRDVDVAIDTIQSVFPVRGGRVAICMRWNSASGALRSWIDLGDYVVARRPTQGVDVLAILDERLRVRGEEREK
jgi:hypothetical protein